jgi:hypothetical protein
MAAEAAVVRQDLALLVVLAAAEVEVTTVDCLGAMAPRIPAVVVVVVVRDTVLVEQAGQA